MGKQALIDETEDTSSSGKLGTDVIRVEESMEDFIRLRLPSVKGTSKTEVKPLWATKDGRGQFFRVNYWLHQADGFITTRLMIQSRFIKVENVHGKGKVLTDLTVS
jgi:hypothetical protein